MKILTCDSCGHEQPYMVKVLSDQCKRVSKDQKICLACCLNCIERLACSVERISI